MDRRLASRLLSEMPRPRPGQSGQTASAVEQDRPGKIPVDLPGPRDGLASRGLLLRDQPGRCLGGEGVVARSPGGVSAPEHTGPPVPSPGPDVGRLVEAQAAPVPHLRLPAAGAGVVDQLDAVQAIAVVRSRLALAEGRHAAGRASALDAGGARERPAEAQPPLAHSRVVEQRELRNDTAWRRRQIERHALEEGSSGQASSEGLNAWRHGGRGDVPVARKRRERHPLKQPERKEREQEGESSRARPTHDELRRGVVSSQCRSHARSRTQLKRHFSDQVSERSVRVPTPPCRTVSG